MVPAALHGERGGDDRHVAPGRRRASIVAGRGSRPGRRRCFASEKVRKLQLLLTTTRARGKADRVVLARRTNRARRALVSHDPDHGARNTAVAPSQSAMVTTRSLPMPGCLLAAALASLPRVAPAQRAGRRHSPGMSHRTRGTAPGTVARVRATKPGPSAFAAIQEILPVLGSAPETGWSKLELGGLRRHLVDMSHVTLRAGVAASPVRDGIHSLATGSRSAPESIRRMAVAGARTTNRTYGMPRS